jgi:type II secretory pathway component PulK
VRPSKHVALRAAGGREPIARRFLGNEQGIALVITLFVVALVAVLVLEYHFDASVELDLAANYANDVQAYHLALAGVHFAQALLQRDNSKSDGPENDWYKLGLVPACFAPQQLLDLATTGGGESLAAVGSGAKEAALIDRPFADASGGDVGCVSLRITDEDSKLPINALMPQVTPQATGSVNPPADHNWEQIFLAFFTSFKINQPEEVVTALIDWIDADDTPRSAGGAERSYYERLPVPYKPPDSRMRTPEELRLVKGLENPEELVKLFPGATLEAMADIDLGSNSYLTPFGADTSATPPQPARVNVNTATPEVLTALIAGSQQGNSVAQAIAQGIVAMRQEKQFATLPNELQGIKDSRGNPVAGVKSTYFRVESVGAVGNVRKKIVAVLKPPNRGQQQANPLNVNQPMLYFKVE